MGALGGITFLSPWILAALGAVPIIWWLLRVMPPQPKKVAFPAFFLLRDLQTDIRTPSHTPWWLLLLRSLAIVLFILALADPVQKIGKDLPGQGGSVLMVVDNGFASAAHWHDRQDKMKEYLPQIARSGRSVLFMAMAPSPLDGKITLEGPMDVSAASAWIDRLDPQPWPQDNKAALEAIDQGIGDKLVSYSLYFADGTLSDRSALTDLLEKMRAMGGLTVVSDDKINTPYILRRSEGKPGSLSFTVERLQAKSGAASMSLSAYGESGALMDTLPFEFAAGESKASVSWDVMPEMRNKIARVSVTGVDGASAVFLTDSGWRQKPAGILASPAQKDNESFLNEVYYLRRAMEGNGAPAIGTFDELEKKQMSALIWPDSAILSAVERVALLEWVEQGGFLIRFAGANLASQPEDPLLPVKLRFGQRAMEGSMTWEKPLHLADIAPESPLFGLTSPKDVTVTRQVLASPSPESFERTWLQLEDGTPLVTGGSVGKGVVVLIHTTAGPDWSNYCYSGLFVESLKRMLSLSAGISAYKGTDMLPPLTLVDGYGQLNPPDPRALVQQINPADSFFPSPKTPPGIYGAANNFSVFNMGDVLPPFSPFVKEAPSGAVTASYAASGERAYKGDLMKWGLLLLIADALVTLALRGLISIPARRAAVWVALCSMVLSMAMGATIAHAAEAEEADLATNVYLAYMETGDGDTDEVSRNGLESLARMLKVRTTIRVKGVESVNPDVDDLHYYPFIYWPMTEAQMPLSMTAARNVQDYLNRGGMILFDTRDRQFGDTNGATIGTQKLRQVTETLRMPELMTVGEGHILTRSFYLLDDFPGLYTGGKLWVEKEPSPNYDAVTSIIIGGNDWAAAWSDDPQDRSRFSLAGGEQQREMAYRFGVNLVMVSLAGNYKADQVHIPYILERLKR